MKILKFNFPQYSDERGNLVVIEENIPFDIKRVYYIYGSTADVIRGQHAHKTLDQVLICVAGRCKILLDDGTEKKIIELSSPNEGVYVPHHVWHDMYEFSINAVLLVLASAKFYEPDYICEYNDFLEYIRENKEDE